MGHTPIGVKLTIFPAVTKNGVAQYANSTEKDDVEAVLKKIERMNRGSLWVWGLKCETMDVLTAIFF